MLECANAPIYRKVFTPFCRKYLEENSNLSPFAVLRSHIHELTRMINNMQWKHHVSWYPVVPNPVISDVLTIGTHQVVIEVFKQIVHDELDRLEKLVKEEVLFGIELEELGISCTFPEDMDNGDESTVGYGIFNSDGNDVLDNPDSDKFVKKMLEIGALGLQYRDGQLHFDQRLSISWSGIIHEVMALLYVMCHILAGLPGRGVEEQLMALCNLAETRRHLYARAGTLHFNCNYHKGALSTGIYKSIIRVLPYRVACILYILIRIIRPIEVFPLLKFIVKPEKKTEMMKTYRSRVFASFGKAWDASRLSKILMQWFKRHLGFEMGLRMFRHFATALERRYLTFQDSSNLHAQISHAADEQAGRTKETSERNYAVEKGTSSVALSKQQLHRLVSEGWHKMFDIKTYL